MTSDATLLRINEGVQLHHAQGRPDEARDLLARLWDEIGGEAGDPLYVSVLAHSMADVQGDVREELRWDERALAAAGRLTDERLAEAGVPMSVDGLYPSLHISLAECHRKLGDPGRAREHLDLARAKLGALGDTEYAQLIRDGLDRVSSPEHP